jgi:hypothetical protein
MQGERGMTSPLLHPSPYEADAGELIGRDPRDVSADEYREHLPDAQVGLRAIRAKCLDCCGQFSSEVRKCVLTSCALWPLRMGVVPKGLNEARGNKGRAKREGDDA